MLLSCLPLNTTLSFCLVLQLLCFWLLDRCHPFLSRPLTRLFFLSHSLFVSAAVIADVLPLLIRLLSLIPEDESGAVSEFFGNLCELPKPQVSQCITL